MVTHGNLKNSVTQEQNNVFELDPVLVCFKI